MDGKQSDRETCLCSSWPDRDRPWSREAPQVIVVVPHFLSLQAQLERCDQGNMAGGSWGREGGAGGTEWWEQRDRDCAKRKQEEKDFD